MATAARSAPLAIVTIGLPLSLVALGTIANPTPARALESASAAEPEADACIDMTEDSVDAYSRALSRINEVPNGRLALVIGNDLYKSSDPAADAADLDDLENGANDAIAVSRLAAQFKYAVLCLLNANRTQIVETLVGISEHTADLRVVFFYFAGHGFSHQGETYLVPTGARPASSDLLLAGSVSYRNAERYLVSGGAKVISILDMCRARIDFPSGVRAADDGEIGGYGRVDFVPNVIVQFSSADYAKDLPDESNGLYAQHFLRVASAYRGPVNALFAEIYDSVVQDSRGQGQRPVYSVDQFGANKTFLYNEVTDLARAEAALVAVAETAEAGGFPDCWPLYGLVDEYSTLVPTSDEGARFKAFLANADDTSRRCTHALLASERSHLKAPAEVDLDLELSGSGVRVRARPNSNAAILGQIYKGEPAAALIANALEVDAPRQVEGRTGWVFLDSRPVSSGFLGRGYVDGSLVRATNSERQTIFSMSANGAEWGEPFPSLIDFNADPGGTYSIVARDLFREPGDSSDHREIRLALIGALETRAALVARGVGEDRVLVVPPSREASAVLDVMESREIAILRLDDRGA